MNETITYCPNCNAPIFFLVPVEDARLTCSNCGLRMYGRKFVVEWENKVSKYLSKGIAPKW